MVAITLFHSTKKRFSHTKKIIAKMMGFYIQLNSSSFLRSTEESLKQSGIGDKQETLSCSVLQKRINQGSMVKSTIWQLFKHKQKHISTHKHTHLSFPRACGHLPILERMGFYLWFMGLPNADHYN